MVESLAAHNDTMLITDEPAQAHLVRVTVVWLLSIGYLFALFYTFDSEVYNVD